MTYAHVRPWCAICTNVSRTPKHESTAESASRSPKVFGQGYASLAQLIVRHERLSIERILKYWGGMLLVLDAIHQGSPRNNRAAGLMVQSHSTRWLFDVDDAVLVQGANPKWEGMFIRGVNHFEELPGKVLFKCCDDMVLHEPGPARPGINDRFSAPEVAPGNVIDATADVFLAANIALTLFAEGTLALDGSNATYILDAIRLFRPDLPPELHAFIRSSLSSQPSSRPPTPRTAYATLARIVERQLSVSRTCSASIPVHQRLRGRRLPPTSAATVIGKPAKSENEDAFIVRKLLPEVWAAAVFDGVSTADVESGAFAASTAKHIFDRYLSRIQNNRDTLPSDKDGRTCVDWLAHVSGDMFDAAHHAIIKQTIRRHYQCLSSDSNPPQSTCTMLLTIDNVGLVSWLGDSPAFLVKRGVISPLTTGMSAGNEALYTHRSVAAYHEVDNPHALKTALGAFAVDGRGEITFQERVGLLQAPFRIDGRTFVLVATDGLLDVLGRSADEILDAIQACAGDAFMSSIGILDATESFFQQIAELAEQSTRHDDTTFIVYGAEPRRLVESTQYNKRSPNNK